MTRTPQRTQRVFVSTKEGFDCFAIYTTLHARSTRPSHANPMESLRHNHMLGPVQPPFQHYHTNHDAKVAAKACSRTN